MLFLTSQDWNLHFPDGEDRKITSYARYEQMRALPYSFSRLRQGCSESVFSLYRPFPLSNGISTRAGEYIINRTLIRTIYITKRELQHRNLSHPYDDFSAGVSKTFSY